MARSKSKPTTKEPEIQSNPRKGVDDFIPVVRCLECDEDRARFEAQLGKIAKAAGNGAA
jgi:hypothetical protein